MPSNWMINETDAPMVDRRGPESERTHPQQKRRSLDVRHITLDIHLIICFGSHDDGKVGSVYLPGMGIGRFHRERISSLMVLQSPSYADLLRRQLAPNLDSLGSMVSSDQFSIMYDSGILSIYQSQLVHYEEEHFDALTIFKVLELLGRKHGRFSNADLDRITDFVSTAPQDAPILKYREKRIEENKASWEQAAKEFKEKVESELKKPEPITQNQLKEFEATVASLRVQLSTTQRELAEAKKEISALKSAKVSVDAGDDGDDSKNSEPPTGEFILFKR